MRLKSYRPPENNLDLSTTGFIDVVFLLLIFFLITSTFLLPEKQLQSNIAVQRESAVRTNELEPAIIKVTMTNQQPMFSIGMFNTSDESELLRYLGDFINKEDGAFVRASGDVPFDATAKAVAACRASGFKIVTYVPTR
ncbi:MAG TPA: biopolymer transporter ExbD [Pirellulaceae bacterium]|nr:biopolymer transporter ExbD [Pirellulaceae bacterium]HMO91672.1 biopolymer transporter ExbD [Pirellulaceae bacterium]HMP68369.1 biopolymer transporter ExbD [Pirellulaceae bacterium]